jgi:ectoine hydroxylase-related dioxygenase (phytanoyl-CoA dioxygenase family)
MNGKRKYGYSPYDSFLHTDQAPQKGYFWGYQGLINLVDSGPESGGLVIIPNSHLKHKDYFNKHNLFGHKNWYLVPEHHKNQEPFLPVEKLVLKAGDFALWDSRTFHCNTTPEN